MFPVSYIAYDALEYLFFYQILKKSPENECSVSFPGGITAAAVFICLNIANNFAQAVFLSFGFAAGICLVMIITGEIRRRAALEAVPVFLRGKPLVLISMGMLSLVFSTGALLIFRMIGTK
jgi:electron transport complex protein RnfA